MKNNGEKKEKQLKAVEITKTDVVLSVACPPVEAGILLFKYIRNGKVKKAKEVEEKELEQFISSKKDQTDGEIDEVEIIKEEA